MISPSQNLVQCIEDIYHDWSTKFDDQILINLINLIFNFNYFQNLLIIKFGN